MTLREKIADWISGGALSDAIYGRKYWQDACRKWSNQFVDRHVQSAEYREALNKIIAEETPRANATVRRMVKIAKEAVDG